MKAVVAAFNQEKALVGAFSVITNLQMDLFEALVLDRGQLRHVSVRILLLLLAEEVMHDVGTDRGAEISSTKITQF